MFSNTPVVYAVGTDYQIFFFVSRSAYARLKVGDAVYDDVVCGILRSAPGLRQITVPQKALNAAGGYTLSLQRIRERKSYWTETIGVTERYYPFYPVPETGNVRAYMLGDAHGDKERTLAAAGAFGAFDFLIVNGDVNESISVRHFELAHNLAAELTGGSRPVVYVRGNHELRGALAEQLTQYIPTQDGNTYYTFRLGSVWGIVLDCGEDKPDDHGEYGGYARFHPFRLAQTDYLRRVVRHAKTEFDAPGVTTRIAVVHTQFPRKQEPAFDIERPLFQRWCDLLGSMGTDVILSAHEHRFAVLQPGDPALRLQTTCPLVIGAANNKEYIGGTGYVFSPDAIRVEFTASDGTAVPPVTLRKENR